MHNIYHPTKIDIHPSLHLQYLSMHNIYHPTKIDIHPSLHLQYLSMHNIYHPSKIYIHPHTSIHRSIYSICPCIIFIIHLKYTSIHIHPSIHSSLHLQYLSMHNIYHPSKISIHPSLHLLYLSIHKIFVSIDNIHPPTISSIHPQYPSCIHKTHPSIFRVLTELCWTQLKITFSFTIHFRFYIN